MKQLAVAPGMETYVVDALAARLSRFSEAGVLEWTVGRRGEGPEEFSGMLLALESDSEGNAHLLDAGRGRIAVWCSDGTLCKIIPLPISGYGAVTDFAVDGRGRYVIQRLTTEQSLESVVTDLMLFDPLTGMMTSAGDIQSRKNVRRGPAPGFEVVIWDWADSIGYVTHKDDYTVRTLPSGATLLSRNVIGRVPTAEEIRDLREGLGLPLNGGREISLGIVEDVLATDDGVWIVQGEGLRNRLDYLAGNSNIVREMILYGTSGEEVKRLRLPPGFVPMAARRDRIAGVLFGPFDEPLLRVYRVTGLR